MTGIFCSFAHLAIRKLNPGKSIRIKAFGLNSRICNLQCFIFRRMVDKFNKTSKNPMKESSLMCF